MDLHFNTATLNDLAPLMEIMGEFYELEGLDFNQERAMNAAHELMGNKSLGRIWLITDGGELIGYLVVTVCFSLEFSGHFALLDEIYLRSPYQGRGIGTAALGMVDGFCRSRGIRAIRLEVDHDNGRAEKLYERSGFIRHSRHLMTKWLVV